MVRSYSEGYTHGVTVWNKPTAAITTDTPTSAANKILRNCTSAVRLFRKKKIASVPGLPLMCAF